MSGVAAYGTSAFFFFSLQDVGFALMSHVGGRAAAKRRQAPPRRKLAAAAVAAQDKMGQVVLKYSTWILSTCAHAYVGISQVSDESEPMLNWDSSNLTHIII